MPIVASSRLQSRIRRNDVILGECVRFQHISIESTHLYIVRILPEKFIQPFVSNREFPGEARNPRTF